MQLPASFISTIRSTFKEDGEKFLAVLPDLITETSHRWGLTGVQPVSNLSYNFVAFARRGREDVILKIGVPHRELTSEIAALKFFDGKGVCQLLESDAEHGFLLLERLKPGIMLSELEDDAECTNIAADLILRRGGVTPPLQDTFIQLSDWFDGLKKIRPHFGGGTGPFSEKLLEQVEASLPELFAVGADRDPPLLHGDFHHFNILSSERGWLVIDPKGVIGPAGYEIGPFMLNPWNISLDGIRLERRVSIFAERLGWEREVIIKWSTAHAVLSAWWDIADGVDASHTLHCAEIFSGMK